MDALHTYFDGERQAGLCAALLGLISCAFATWLWSTTSTFRAMLVPIGLVGIIQLGVGVGLWVKTPGQVAALESGLGQPAAAAHTARSTEIVRMERVMKSFLVIKAVELVLIAVGAGRSSACASAAGSWASAWACSCRARSCSPSTSSPRPAASPTWPGCAPARESVRRRRQ
jgi:hypothetical protein